MIEALIDVFPSGESDMDQLIWSVMGTIEHSLTPHPAHGLGPPIDLLGRRTCRQFDLPAARARVTLWIRRHAVQWHGGSGACSAPASIRGSPRGGERSAAGAQLSIGRGSEGDTRQVDGQIQGADENGPFVSAEGNQAGQATHGASAKAGKQQLSSAALLARPGSAGHTQQHASRNLRDADSGGSDHSWHIQAHGAVASSMPAAEAPSQLMPGHAQVWRQSNSAPGSCTGSSTEGEATSPRSLAQLPAPTAGCK